MNDFKAMMETKKCKSEEMLRGGHFLFLKCNCFPHLATSISTVMRNSNFSNWPQSMQCTERVKHEFEAIILMVTWHHNERNRNPWSSSERFCEKQQWLVFSYRSVGKKQEQIIFWSQHLLHYWKLNYARKGGKGHDKVFSFSLFHQKFSLRSCLSH